MHVSVFVGSGISMRWYALVCRQTDVYIHVMLYIVSFFWMYISVFMVEEAGAINFYLSSSFSGSLSRGDEIQ